MVTKSTGRDSKELITRAAVRRLLIFGGTRYCACTINQADLLMDTEHFDDATFLSDPIKLIEALDTKESEVWSLKDDWIFSRIYNLYKK